MSDDITQLIQDLEAMYALEESDLVARANVSAKLDVCLTHMYAYSDSKMGAEDERDVMNA